MSKIDTYVKWALNIAADVTHGYDQTNRWGPDYDCSSFVITAVETAGIPVKTAGATYTENMLAAFKECGFTDVTSSVNRYTGASMKKGDILLNTANHAAIYIGSEQLVQASLNELGTVTGGTSGDQTGKEISVGNYYNYPWNYVLRYNADTSTSVTLPSGLGAYFTYMGWQLITSTTSTQYKLREQAGQNFDSEGFGKINGRYVVACTTTYGAVGDYIDVYQANGNIFKCIIGDIKNQSDSGCTKWGHNNGQCVIEFVVDKNTWYNPMHANPGTASCHPEWGGTTIIKIVNLGSYFSGTNAVDSGSTDDDSGSDTVELCSTSVVSTVNVSGTLNDNTYLSVTGDSDTLYEMHIINNGVDYQPIVVGTVKWTTEWKDTAGKLEFTLLKDSQLNIQEGNAVCFLKNGTGIFYGYLFTKSRNKNGQIKCTAYDQLRYLKNKDTYCYKAKTLKDVIVMIAADYRLKVDQSKIADTGYTIPGRVEDDETLFDIIKNARDLTENATGKMYVLYDDYGLLALKEISELATDYLLDDETCEDMDYKTTIDEDVYNQIQFYKDDDSTGNREKYIYNNADLINQWGVLQLTCKIENGDNPATFGETVLKLYSEKKRELTVKDCFGDVRLRAGASLYVNLNVGDVVYQGAEAIVKKAVHKFGAKYSCDLTLLGGEPYVG